MPGRFLIQLFSACTMIALIVSSCGSAAVPTAAPTATQTGKGPIPGATATPATQGMAPTTGGAVSGEAQLKALPFLPYSMATARALVAKNFYIGGMEWGQGEEPQYGGTATFAHRMQFPCGDPSQCGTVSINGAVNSVMGGGNLVRPKETNNFEPEGNVASSWEVSPDFMQWTFHMRPDVKWHDGDAVTAQDIKFWIDLYCFPPAGRKVAATCPDFGPLKEVQVLDPVTVRLIEKEPSPFLLETMATFNLALTHKRNLAQPFIDKGKPAVQMQDIGWVSIGPFKVDRYDEGSQFKVVRNPLYFKKDAKGRQLPYLDGIIHPIIPDPQTGVSAFRAGKVDRTAAGSGYHLSPNHVTAIEKGLAGKVWYERSFYSGWGVIPNATVAPFNDIKLRRAIQLFIDREEWSELAYGGFASLGGAMFPGSYYANTDYLTWPGYNPATKKQDQAEGLKIIKEAGATGLKFGINTRDNYVFNAEAAEAQFRKMGLEAKIIILDTNRNTEMQQTGQYQTVLGSLGAAFPSRLLLAYVTENPIAGNKTGDTKIDEMHRAIASSVDPVKRRELAKQAEYYLLQEKYYAWPGPWEESTVGVRSYIKGMWVGGNTPLINNAHQGVWIDAKMR